MRNDFCSNYLEHSALGSTWKKGTKYIDKIKKNGKWIYRYKITGQGYKTEAWARKMNSDNDSKHANAAKYYQYSGSGTAYNNGSRSAERNGRLAAQAEHDYSTKSLAGNIERGKKTISKLLDSLKTTETVTITSNLYPAGTKKVIKKK